MGADGWMTIPVSEFEMLHETIKRLTNQRDAYVKLARTINEQVARHKERVAELENELRQAYSERDHLAQRVFDLQVEVRGYQWGESNANAEAHAIEDEFDDA